MFNIALLDDEQSALIIAKGAIENFFKEKNYPISLYCYNTAAELLKDNKIKRFGLLFLDIDVGDKNGIDVAKEIEECKQNASIIFLSQREDLVFDCLKIHPFGFIRKSKIIEDFNLLMNQYYNFVITTEADDKIDFVDKNNVVTFKLREIIYIESERNYQVIHLLDDETYKIRIPLNNLEEQLTDKGFIRIHKGFLLNYTYIRSIQNESIILANHFTLPLSKKRKEEVMQQYLKYSRSKNLLPF